MNQWLRTAVMVVLGAACLSAQKQELEAIALRVTSVLPNGNVSVDRGSRDGVKVGDRVIVRPRRGGDYQGRILRVEERSSLVEFTTQKLRAVSGMRGEVLIPRARFEPDPEPAKPVQQPPDKSAKKSAKKAAKKAGETSEGEVGEKRPETEWENEDKEWRAGMPLLKKARPVRPENRPVTMAGRVYTVANLTSLTGSDFDNSLFRVGTDLLYENVLGYGGGMRVNTEVNYKTEPNKHKGVDLLVRRLSYYRGGSRFAPGRFEVGRFLQHGMPEFGVLDGVEWGYRQEKGSRFGGSFGWMPTLDDDFETGQDSQVAAYYEWSSDLTEMLVLSAGFQKTFHDDHSDRDLLITKLRYLPIDAWQVHGSLWIDFYSSDDTAKGAGVELTQAFITTSRRWDDSGVDFSFRRVQFPELLRTGEFLPVDRGELSIKRYDRLVLDGWTGLSSGNQVRGQANVWNDDRGNGVGGEVGLDVLDLFADQSRSNFAIFGGLGSYESIVGGRVSYGRSSFAGRWDVLYELSLHHFTGFPEDANDMLQHRVRASQSWYTEAGWDVSLHADGYVWEDELSWSLGVQVQKSF